MLKKRATLMLLSLLLHASGGSAFAVSQDREAARQVVWVKAVVARLGVGEMARVCVQLRNREEVEGYISQTGDVDFIVRGSTGREISIAYSDVMVTQFTEVRSHAPDSTAGTVAVIGVAPRRASRSVRLPQWKCNRLWEQYNDAYDVWEAAGKPPAGPQVDAVVAYFEEWFDGCT